MKNTPQEMETSIDEMFAMIDLLLSIRSFALNSCVAHISPQPSPMGGSAIPAARESVQLSLVLMSAKLVRSSPCTSDRSG